MPPSERCVLADGPEILVLAGIGDCEGEVKRYRGEDLLLSSSVMLCEAHWRWADHVSTGMLMRMARSGYFTREVAGVSDGS